METSTTKLTAVSNLATEKAQELAPRVDNFIKANDGNGAVELLNEAMTIIALTVVSLQGAALAMAMKDPTATIKDKLDAARHLLELTQVLDEVHTDVKARVDEQESNPLSADEVTAAVESLLHQD